MSTKRTGEDRQVLISAIACAIYREENKRKTLNTTLEAIVVAIEKQERREEERQQRREQAQDECAVEPDGCPYEINDSPSDFEYQGAEGCFNDAGEWRSA